MSPGVVPGGPGLPQDGRARPGRCPTCGKATDPQGLERPFCSPRCKLVDLGRWLKGHYVIPGEPVGRLPGEDGDDEPEPER